MKYFVIGASGLIGSNCLSYLEKQNIASIGTYLNYQVPNTFYFDTLDIQGNRNYAVDVFKPDIIIHTAGLTHVDYCEEYPEQSFRSNVAATRHVILMAKRLSAKLIYISTDYIFNGSDGPYAEEAAPDPLNVYGMHKMQSEQMIQQELTDYLIIRVTNVYGNEIRNKNFISRVITHLQSGQISEFILPYDQYATPVNAADIARAIVRLTESNCTGVYHIASTDYYSRVQLFKKIVEYFPGNVGITMKPIATSNMKQRAKRPISGGLLSKKFLAQFPDFSFTNVDHYLKGLNNHM